MNVSRRSILSAGAAMAGVPASAQEQHRAFLSTLRPSEFESATNKFGLELEATLGQPLPPIMYGLSGSYVQLQPGVFDLYQTIEIGNGSPTRLSSIQSLSLTGCGSGANEGEFGDQSAGTLLRWRGPIGQPMIRVNGPIYSVAVRGLSLDCAGSANGIEVNHAINSSFDNLQIRNARQYAFSMVGTAQARPGMAIGCGGNRIVQVRTFNAAVGFKIGSDLLTTNVGCSANVFEQCSSLGGRVGWQLRFCDYIRLIMCQSYFAQIPMLIQPPDDGGYFPTAIYAEHWSADAVPQVLGNWNPFPNTGVVFHQYHREWNGGPAMLDSSFGPLFPKLRGFSGTDNLGNVYPHVR